MVLNKNSTKLNLQMYLTMHISQQTYLNQHSHRLTLCFPIKIERVLTMYSVTGKNE